jgi:hypothetical protein
MERRRLTFLSALVLFVLWIAALGLLAIKSGRRPMVLPPRPAASAPR